MAGAKETIEVKRSVNKICIILTLGILAITSQAQAKPIYRTLNDRYHVEIGIASWYGNSHAGRKTFSEEPFNPRAMTCAHKTLPMQTVIRVINTSDDSKILCRVNDRGPFVRGRIVDLSEKAAEKLNVGKKGILPVRIEVVRLGSLPYIVASRRDN